jgi:hypothetical protein
VIALLLTLFGCPGPEPEPECRDAGDCDGLALCTSDGTCLAVDCLSSEHCPMEHTCDGDGWDVCRDEIGGECRWFGDAYYCTPPCDPAGPENGRPRAFDCLDVAGGSVERWRLWGDCPAYIAQQTPDESPT